MGSLKKWPTAAPPAVQRWSTEDVPAHQKLDYWAGAICEVYLRAECSAVAREGFDGVIESVVAGEVNFTRMASSSIAMRTLSSGVGSCKDVIYLTSDRRSGWTIKQNGHVQQVRSGDVCLIDAREPYQVIFHEGMSLCALELPLPWVRRHLRHDEPGSRVISRDLGWGRVLSALALELSGDLHLVTQVPEQQVLDQLGGLLIAAAEPIVGPAAGGAGSLAERAEQVLRERLEEPGLTAADVAQALGISVRTLHRLYAAQGTTFASALREHRLQRALALLQRPNFADLPVAEVGARCGFQDPSHFAREFRRRSGLPPSKWRQRLADEGA